MMACDRQTSGAHRAPESFQPAFLILPIDRQAMANAPVVVMPRAIAADLARAVIGPDDLAEPTRVKIARRIIGRRIAIVARAEMVPMMEVGAARPEVMMPDNSRRGETVAAAAMECRACAKAAAAKYRAATAEAAAVNSCTTAAEAANAAATKATTSAATEPATNMAAAISDFRQSVRGVFC